VKHTTTAAVVSNSDAPLTYTARDAFNMWSALEAPFVALAGATGVPVPEIKVSH
jgi:hypothetical protein